MVTIKVVIKLYSCVCICMFPASHLIEEANALATRYPGIEPVYLSVEEGDASSGSLASLVRGAHVVVSLLPYNLHAAVAQACITSGTHLVTASYVTNAVGELHKK